MNKERILELADLIEKQPHTEIDADSGFNMLDFNHLCGTPSCIAGWAVFQSNGNLEYVNSEEARIALGLNRLQCEDLFFAWSSNLSLEDITPAHAAFTLRHLAETGVVDWSAYTSSKGANLNG